MIQYNGEFGCSVCEIQGQSQKTDKGGTVRVFPKHEPEPDNEFLRNERRTIAQALIALEERTTVKGIRGMSVLGGIPSIRTQLTKCIYQ